MQRKKVNGLFTHKNVCKHELHGGLTNQASFEATKNPPLTIKLRSLNHEDPGVEYILLPTDYLGCVQDDYKSRLGYNRDESAICLYRKYAQSLHYDRNAAENNIKDGEVIIVLAMVSHSKVFVVCDWFNLC